MTEIEISRKQVASLGNLALAGALTFQEFCEAVPYAVWNDPDVEALTDLLEYKPKVGGFLGVSPARFQQYQNEVQEVITRLQTQPESLPAAEMG